MKEEIMNAQYERHGNNRKRLIIATTDRYQQWIPINESDETNNTIESDWFKQKEWQIGHPLYYWRCSHSFDRMSLIKGQWVTRRLDAASNRKRSETVLYAQTTRQSIIANGMCQSWVIHELTNDMWSTWFDDVKKKAGEALKVTSQAVSDVGDSSPLSHDLGSEGCQGEGGWEWTLPFRNQP